MLRYAYSSPTHNLQSEETQVLQRLSKIEQRMKEIGLIALGPGNYALGRGYVALRQYKEARVPLEEAWDKYGFRTPQAAYNLGLVLAMLYQRELEAADRLESNLTS